MSCRYKLIYFFRQMAYRTAGFMVYELITLNTPYMSGNQFFNFFVLAIMELPGTLLAGFLIVRLGRRWTPVIFNFVIVIACLAAGLATADMNLSIIICIVLAKLAVTVTLYVAFVQTTELFPTPLRSTGSAVTSLISASFGLLNPSVVYAGRVYSGAPYLVMAVISLIGCVCAAFLPETLRQRLPETIEDAEDFGKGNKFWSLRPGYDRKLRKSIRRSLRQTTQNLQNT